jgi:DNA-binding GntR family transcriptional regulator
VTVDARRKNGAQHVYAQLKDILVNYQVAPGRHLHPNDFVHLMKVSNTPIRDAMHRLSGEHLLVFVPNKGFFTKVLDLAEMRELCVLKFVLLQHSIFAVETDREDPLVAESERLRGVRHSAELCSAFAEELFELIASQSQSESLTRLLRNLIDRTHYIRTLDLEELNRRQEVAMQMNSLVESLAMRNTPAAIQILRVQLQTELARLPTLVKEGLVRSHTSRSLAMFPDLKAG